MLQRNVMLNDRAHAILAAKIGLLKFSRSEKSDIDESKQGESKHYKISLLDWQCSCHHFDDEEIIEFVQQRSESGPINFAYLALKNSRGLIIDDSLWTPNEIESSEILFAQLTDIKRVKRAPEAPPRKASGPDNEKRSVLDRFFPVARTWVVTDPAILTG